MPLESKSRRYHCSWGANGGGTLLSRRINFEAARTLARRFSPNCHDPIWLDVGTRLRRDIVNRNRVANILRPFSVINIPRTVTPGLNFFARDRIVMVINQITGQGTRNRGRQRKMNRDVVFVDENAIIYRSEKVRTEKLSDFLLRDGSDSSLNFCPFTVSCKLIFIKNCEKF